MNECFMSLSLCTKDNSLKIDAIFILVLATYLLIILGQLLQVMKMKL